MVIVCVMMCVHVCLPTVHWPSQCVKACASEPNCTWYNFEPVGRAPVSEKWYADTDCQGHDIGDARRKVRSAEECLAVCERRRDCGYFVYDTLPDRAGQCADAPGEGVLCCVMWWCCVLCCVVLCCGVVCCTVLWCAV